MSIIALWLTALCDRPLDYITIESKNNNNKNKDEYYLKNALRVRVQAKLEFREKIFVPISELHKQLTHEPLGQPFILILIFVPTSELHKQLTREPLGQPFILILISVPTSELHKQLTHEPLGQPFILILISVCFLLALRL